MPTWVTSTTAASVLEAKESQKVMQLKLLCAEGSQRLNRGEVELRVSLCVRVAVNRGRESTCAGVLRAREAW
eukprot:7104332-Prymnesium_polylepis.1